MFILMTSSITAKSFIDNLEEYIGSKITFTLVHHNGEYGALAVGILKEVYDDNILIYHNKEKKYTYIKIEYISSFIIEGKDKK